MKSDSRILEVPSCCSFRSTLWRKGFSLRLMCVVLAALLPALFSSCKQTSNPASAPHKLQAVPVKREYGEGPVRVRIIADKDTITVAQDLSLRIEAESEEGYDIKLPDFREKLGEFSIADSREDPPKLSKDGRLLSRKVYKLEPFLAGDYKIPPMTISFTKNREEGRAKEGSSNLEENGIETGEIVIKVRSLIGEDRKDLEIQPIFGPVELPSRLAPLWYILLGIGLAAIFAAGGFYWFKHRKRIATGAAKPPSAHELAYRQLKELLDEKLAERGQFKLFFAGISDILRFYIENRFGLHAPKKTTEEFLAVLSRSRQAHFPIEHHLLLDDFLHYCDLVKFAEHLPSPEEVGKAVEACKAFIEATRAVEPGGGEAEEMGK